MPHSIKPSIPIIYYHSVGPVNPGWKRNFLTLELPFFEDQLKYFKNNFNLISLKAFYNIRAGLQNSPKKPLVITIDDGYLDNWIWAFPMLKKYDIPATLFVNPEMADPRNLIRPNLEDYWTGNVSLEDLNLPGHLSWEEMKKMEASGLIDIQSHTMSHTKYFVSGKLEGFHHPGEDVLYAAGNRFLNQKPFHIANPKFERLLLYGFPLFEERSSIIAKKIEINPDFVNQCVSTLSHYNFNHYNFRDAFKLVAPVYQQYLDNHSLIVAVEDEEAYKKRITYEIMESKKIIERKLGKKVEFLCWPHGDHNATAHQLAIQGGYLATTSGSKQNTPDCLERIPTRIGIFHVRHNRLLSLLKVRYKLGCYLGRPPWKDIQRLYHLFKTQNVSRG